MDRSELLDAIEELMDRLDVTPDEEVSPEDYSDMTNALETLKDLVARRIV